MADNELQGREPLATEPARFDGIHHPEGGAPFQVFEGGKGGIFGPGWWAWTCRELDTKKARGPFTSARAAFYSSISPR